MYYSYWFDPNALFYDLLRPSRKFIGSSGLPDTAHTKKISFLGQCDASLCHLPPYLRLCFRTTPNNHRYETQFSAKTPL